MPHLIDRQRIRDILERDRPWAAYALADLVPGFFESCEWFASSDGAAVVLVYRGFAVPVLIAVGSADALAGPMSEIPHEPEIYAVVRAEAMPLLAPAYAPRVEKPMLRMMIETPVDDAGARLEVARLGPADLDALRALYADGQGSGETPEFFLPALLQTGTYFGVREGRDLVAAGGTHVACEELSVAGLGNIYTRRDRRGQGLSQGVTRAIVDDLVRRRMKTIVLNVRLDNAPARRVYEKLGFRPYCRYFEVEAIASG